MAVCQQFGANVPVVIAREQADEEIIAAAMQQGARDVITLKNPVRLTAVVKRELDAHRQARTLHATINAAREYREQLKSFMAGSADAAWMYCSISSGTLSNPYISSIFCRISF